MYHFITYATDSHVHYGSQLAKSAIDIGGFDSAEIRNPTDIDSEFKCKNKAILNAKKGAGYWLWKPYIILQKLQQINDGDILCYCDSMYTFINSVKNLNINWSQNDIFITHNKPNEDKYIEKWFSKRDALILMDADVPLYYDTIQAWAGFLLIKKTENTIKYVTEWLKYAQDERIISDDKSILGNEYIEFRENRHDQTVLSLLAKKWNISFNDFPQEFMYNLRGLS